MKKGTKSWKNLSVLCLHEHHTAESGSSAQGTSDSQQQELLIRAFRLGHYFPLHCLCCQLRFLKAYANIKF